MDEVLERINKVFRTVFSREDLTVTLETSSGDVEGWDSLQHINLISMMEKEFGITFDIDQIVSMETVGDMVKAVEELAG